MTKKLAEIDVVYPEENGWRTWRDLRKRGDVPDQWPYGLNRLSEVVEVVRPLDLPRLSRRELLMVAVGGRGKQNSDRAKYRTIGISWDERSALRMAGHARFDSMLSGVIWAADDYLGGAGRIRNLVTRRVLRECDAVWCLSKAQVPVIAEWLGIDVSRVSFIQFGVDAEFWGYGGPVDEPPVIVSVGNDRDRDPQTLFAALDLIMKEVPETRAFVQADTDLTPPKGVEKVPRVGHRRLHSLYQRSTLVMVATRANTHVSGMTVALEAMATGRPVVMNATPGMEDYVEDGVAGVLAPVGDAEAMANAAVQFLNSPSRAGKMGREGRRRVESTLNTRAMVRSIGDLATGALRI